MTTRANPAAKAGTRLRARNRSEKLFNGSAPADDTQFLNYVINPTLPPLLTLVLGANVTPTNLPRTDLATTFFGLGTLVWIIAGGVLVQGLLTVILTFTFELLVGYMLKEIIK